MMIKSPRRTISEPDQLLPTFDQYSIDVNSSLHTHNKAALSIQYQGHSRSISDTIQAHENETVVPNRSISHMDWSHLVGRDGPKIVTTPIFNREAPPQIHLNTQKTVDGNIPEILNQQWHLLRLGAYPTNYGHEFMGQLPFNIDYCQVTPKTTEVTETSSMAQEAESINQSIIDKSRWKNNRERILAQGNISSHGNTKTGRWKSSKYHDTSGPCDSRGRREEPYSPTPRSPHIGTSLHASSTERYNLKQRKIEQETTKSLSTSMSQKPRKHGKRNLRRRKHAKEQEAEQPEGAIERTEAQQQGEIVSKDGKDQCQPPNDNCQHGSKTRRIRRSRTESKAQRRMQEGNLPPSQGGNFSLLQGNEQQAQSTFPQHSYFIQSYPGFYPSQQGFYPIYPPPPGFRPSSNGVGTPIQQQPGLYQGIPTRSDYQSSLRHYSTNFPTRNQFSWSGQDTSQLDAQTWNFISSEEPG